MTQHTNATQAKLEGALHAAADDVHQLTGRTDQSLRDICDLYPDVPAVTTYINALKALEGFKAERAKNSN